MFQMGSRQSGQNQHFVQVKKNLRSASEINYYEKKLTYIWIFTVEQRLSKKRHGHEVAC